MFLKVKVENINIVINLGTDLTKANDVILMFESNAQYVKEDYDKVSLVKPVATVELGSHIQFEKDSYYNDHSNIVITQESTDVGFVKAENFSFCDVEKLKTKYKTAIDRLKKENQKLVSENNYLKDQLDKSDEESE